MRRTRFINNLSFEFSNKFSSGCSAVRLAHLLWEQGVPGSNPGTPTKKTKKYDL